MLVVIANNLPPAVRGRMKLWFVEPKPNVFVSGIKDSVAQNVMNYLYEHCSQDSGIVLFRSIRRPPGYEVHTIGPTTKQLVQIGGLQLVIECLGQE
ncbi:MAG: type I-E CRISPR-associated endoribonuclease Cas2 [Deltaproteobacteria bacterium]|nr:type I-E CRISPR-associated endoribonuclease Cas2 [Deltaproteobacteria bacterium]